MYSTSSTICADLQPTLLVRASVPASQVTITHDGKGPPIRVQREQREQQQQQQTPEVATQSQQPGAVSDSSKRSHKRNKQQQQQASSSGRDHTGRGRKQQQQQQAQTQQQLPQLRTSQPRPHPFYIKPRHVKRHFKVTTADGWKLHLIRSVSQCAVFGKSASAPLCALNGSSWPECWASCALQVCCACWQLMVLTRGMQ